MSSSFVHLVASLLRVSAKDLSDALTTSSNVTRGRSKNGLNSSHQHVAKCFSVTAIINLR